MLLSITNTRGEHAEHTKPTEPGPVRSMVLLSNRVSRTGPSAPAPRVTTPSILALVPVDQHTERTGVVVSPSGVHAHAVVVDEQVVVDDAALRVGPGPDAGHVVAEDEAPDDDVVAPDLDARVPSPLDDRPAPRAVGG